MGFLQNEAVRSFHMYLCKSIAPPPIALEQWFLTFFTYLILSSNKITRFTKYFHLAVGL